MCLILFTFTEILGYGTTDASRMAYRQSSYKV